MGTEPIQNLVIATSLSLLLSANNPSHAHTFQLHPLERRRYRYRDLYLLVATGLKINLS